MVYKQSLTVLKQVPGWEPEDDDLDEIVEKPLAPPPPPPPAPASRLLPPPATANQAPPPPPPAPRTASAEPSRAPPAPDAHPAKPAAAVIAAGMGGLANEVQVMTDICRRDVVRTTTVRFENNHKIARTAISQTSNHLSHIRYQWMSWQS